MATTIAVGNREAKAPYAIKNIDEGARILRPGRGNMDVGEMV
jgi:hypothetical protein